MAETRRPSMSFDGRTKDELLDILEKSQGRTRGRINMPTLKVVRLQPGAIMPKYSSPFAIGMDLAAPMNMDMLKIEPWSRELIKTGLSVHIPARHYGRIAPRSGLALKKNITVDGGVIDEDYRGEVGVILVNHGDDEFWVKPGDRIAQMILERATIGEIVEVNELDASKRGEGGFGSTGIPTLSPDATITEFVLGLLHEPERTDYNRAVVIVTTDSCSYCDQAINMLTQTRLKTKATVLDVGVEISKERFLQDFKTVPQIWFKGAGTLSAIHFGGFDEMRDWLSVNGHLFLEN